MLLSFPPHLESLDEATWKRLMSICWAGVLGDRIMQDEQWLDEEQNELELDDGDESAMDLDVEISAHGRARSGLTQIQSELLLLIPILLSSHSAPILPTFPTRESPDTPPSSVGYHILLKAHRFLDRHRNETSGHLPVLRSCTLVLAELELNSRSEFITAGSKLLPRLQDLWLARSKPLREQVVIAMRMLLPFLTHYSVAAETTEVVVESLTKMADSMQKEVSLRWGIAPLDMQCLRLGVVEGDTRDSRQRRTFSLDGIQVSCICGLA